MSRKGEAETARAYRLVAASTIKAQDARDDRQKRRGFTPVVPAA
ncbi:hypothetical protein RBWH47_05895 [Rhodopirellula baltica WH47]|uniref:Uncharacterized protein n=1 Tax=Rhodopirellula baltica WH47 TaxID=991778 RepID=F2AW71_RHOBT|nr:hypothetical protein RBWH47_05895 [Rhodopirellula baltica WH47]